MIVYLLILKIILLCRSRNYDELSMKRMRETSEKFSLRMNLCCCERFPAT